MRKFGRFLSMVLVAAMLAGAFTTFAAAKAYNELTPWFYDELNAGDTYLLQNAELLLAVNPDTATERMISAPVEGSFTIEGPASDAALQNRLPAEAEPDTLEPQIREVRPEAPQEVGLIDRDTADSTRFSRNAAAFHAENDTLKLYCTYDQEPEMKCLYVGTHCTVWGSISDKEEIRLNETQAKNIGDEFDRQFEAVTNIFGNYFYDADGDNRVAIMCYDINNEYARNVDPNPYTAGLFDMNDMITRGKDNEGKDAPVIGNLIFVDGNYPYNGIDCIRIDTYPLMGGRGSLMSRIDKCYSTLLHEFQHMLNFSSSLRHCVQRDTNKLYYMDTFLDEAFSMAAEHLVYANDPTKDNAKERVDWFNSTSYVPGRSLTYWSGSLDNYANAFLFGQYIRTRWARKGGCQNDGSSFYQLVYDSCVNTTGFGGDVTKYYTGDALSVIADLLCEPGEDFYSYNALMLDFWAAVCLNQSSGIHGFNGEKWADSIKMRTTGLRWNDGKASDDKIYSSGAKLYTLDPNETYTITAAPNVRLIAMRRNACGENLTWYIADDILYIEGSGKMTSAPWRERNLKFSGVELPAELTALCKDAFSGYELDAVFFGGTKAAWDELTSSHLGSGNSAITNAPTKYFDSDFVRIYEYKAESKDVSLKLITASPNVAFAAARFAENGQFLGYAYLTPGSTDQSTGENEYGGSVHFNVNGAKEFRVMAFNANIPVDSARTFELP